MNPLLQRIEYGANSSFSISREQSGCFYGRWHYHPEIELTLIKKGSGTRIIGDSIEPFSAGDLILIGAYLPHSWRLDARYQAKNSRLSPETVSVHFNEDVGGPGLLAIPEMKRIKDLLSRAKRGIKVPGRTRKAVAAIMEKMWSTTEADRVILLLQALNMLSTADECRVLSILGPVNPGEMEQTDAISRIYHYTLTHFHEKIDIKHLSAIANVSPHSFRRYFRSKTMKTYWQFLLDIRIGHACRLVMENKYTISQICFSCGFNNLSNFNRRFKEKMGVSPLAYARNSGARS